ncbi:MAG TPA: hypothetical protein VFG20_01875 [Planctomycetaceae bacterium]|nr:hypothetical protein [Planctomycetaceae bacterium]
MNQSHAYRRLVNGLAISVLSANVMSAGEPAAYTDEWWALRAQDPPGTRQVEKHGKLWPPQARPTGPKQHWVHQYHHAHYWPHPYAAEDAGYVRAVWQQQACAGWIGATTLHDYHFEPTHELNSVGRDHLTWIAHFAPAQYRTVYVAQGGSVANGQVRGSNVEAALAEICPGGGVPVVVRPDRFQGRPGQEIDRLREMELQAIQPPRLFTVGGSGGSSSGLGGSASNSGSGGGGSSGATNIR